jgi:RNA polymerase sigma factor (TIGR02999 family)
VTQLLINWSNGDRAALDKLMPLVYDELHRLAHRYMSRERPDHTLQTTALVHEAYLRLVDQTKVRWQNRAHFFGIAAHVMRQILMQHARRHHAAKRGGARSSVSLEDAVGLSNEPAVDLIALDEALTSLAAYDSQKSRIVELRFFGGLTVDETAEVLGLSPRTVKREWRVAKAWLYNQLRNAECGLRIGGEGT